MYAAGAFKMKRSVGVRQVSCAEYESLHQPTQLLGLSCYCTHLHSARASILLCRLMCSTAGSLPKHWCAVAEGYQNDWSWSSWYMRRCWERGLISLDKKRLKGDLVRRCKGEAKNFPQRNKRQWPWEICTHYMEKKFHREGGQTPGQNFREVVDLCPWRYLKLGWPCSEHDFGQETSRSPVLTLWLCDKAGQRLRCLCKVYSTLEEPLAALVLPMLAFLIHV